MLGNVDGDWTNSNFTSKTLASILTGGMTFKETIDIMFMIIYFLLVFISNVWYIYYVIHIYF